MKKLSLHMLSLEANNLLSKGEKRAILGGFDPDVNPCSKDIPIHCGCGICVNNVKECTAIIIPEYCFPIDV